MSLNMFLRRGAFAAILAAGAVVASPALAADHRDGAAVKKDPTSDINDVYTWMNGENLVLAMTVHPFAEANTVFSDAVQFVWTIDAYEGFVPSLAVPSAAQTQVHCEFDEAQLITCWVHRAGEISEYVNGDPSAVEGVAGINDLATVFAGLRADPFYFYLTGFNDARATVISEVEAGNVDIATNPTLCPELSAGQLDQLIDDLTVVGPAQQSLNDFATANTLSIVIELSKDLVIEGDATQLAVRASTHAKP